MEGSFTAEVGECGDGLYCAWNPTIGSIIRLGGLGVKDLYFENCKSLLKEIEE